MRRGKPLGLGGILQRGADGEGNIERVGIQRMLYLERALTEEDLERDGACLEGGA